MVTFSPTTERAISELCPKGHAIRARRIRMICVYVIVGVSSLGRCLEEPGLVIRLRRELNIFEILPPERHFPSAVIFGPLRVKIDHTIPNGFISEPWGDIV